MVRSGSGPTRGRSGAGTSWISSDLAGACTDIDVLWRVDASGWVDNADRRNWCDRGEQGPGEGNGRRGGPELDRGMRQLQHVLGVYVGAGVVPSSSTGPEVGPPGHHIVVEVAGPGDCPEVPQFLDGAVVWFTLGWPSGDEAAATREQPAGAIAEYDPVLSVEPAGPYVDGQEATLIQPAGYSEDWINDRPRLCAVVADDPRGPTPHPSWVDLRNNEPGEIEGALALSISVFALGSTEPDVSPFGEYLWGQDGGGPPLPGAGPARGGRGLDPEPGDGCGAGGR